MKPDRIEDVWRNHLMFWYCYSKPSSFPRITLDFQEQFCHHFLLEASSAQTVDTGVVSQSLADNRHYMYPPFPCQAPVSWVRLGLRRKSALQVLGVSFSTTVKPCPSCFALLVPITKEYMHRQVGHRQAGTDQNLVPSIELNVTLNTTDLFLSFLFFCFKLRPGPTLGGGSIRKQIEVVLDFIFPICNTILTVQTAPHNVAAACQAGL